MAGYDASIRVSTQVETSQMQKLQIQIDKATNKVASLSAKLEELKNKKIPTEAYQGLEKELAEAVAEFEKLIDQQEEWQKIGLDQGGAWDKLMQDEDEAAAKIDSIKNKMKQMEADGTAFNIDDSAIDKTAKDLEIAKAELNALNTKQDEYIAKQKKQTSGLGKLAESAKKLMETIKSRLGGLALSLLVFNGISKAFNAMVSQMKEGFKNLAQYSSEYNNSMSALKSQSAQLKNGLAAAFEPLANTIIPYLTTFVSWINRAVDSFGQFLAALHGKSTYTKAKKQVLDYAKSLNTASESAKGALASFDSIQVLSQDSASGNASGEATGAAAFEEGEVDTSMEEKFAPLIDSMERFKTACEPIVGYIKDGLSWLWENVLKPLGSWVLNDAIPSFLDLLSAGLEFLTPIIEAIKPHLQWLWDNILQPIASWVCDTAINGIQFLTEKLQEFGDWCREDEENLSLVTSIIEGFLGALVIYFTVKNVTKFLTDFKDAAKLFFSTMKTGISPIALAAIAIGVLAAGIIYLSQNWDKLSGAQKAITILGALAAAAIAAAVAIAVFHTSWSVGVAAAAIVGGLALLGLTTACLKYNEKKNGQTSESTANDFYNSNDFSGNPLPALAEGAVIPGGRPFAAILGDQPYGQTNIETPLPTMVDAFRQAMGEGGSNRPIYMQIDGRTFAKLQMPYLKQEDSRVGISFRTT